MRSYVLYGGGIREIKTSNKTTEAIADYGPL